MELSKKWLDILYSAAHCFCGKYDGTAMHNIHLEKNGENIFKIYPYIVTIVLNGEKTTRRCLSVYHYSDICTANNIVDNLMIKFENDKMTLFRYSYGNSKKPQKFIENEDWEWFMENLTLKMVETV